MDKPARDARSRIARLVLDPGVLEPAPVLEVFGRHAVQEVGGVAVLPWRSDWLAATELGVAVVREPDELPATVFGQCLVHLQKSRDATWSGLAAGWRRLEPGRPLLLVGGNELGIKSAVRRLENELGQRGEVVTNRARGRVVRFTRTGAGAPSASTPRKVDVDAGGDRFTVASAAGVFSADALDPASRLLIDHLQVVPSPGRIFDPGCGIGVLGLTALRRFPTSTAVLADADWRAVRAAEGNAAGLGLIERCEVRWWDACSEPPPVDHCDLVVLNPPFHSGKAVDLDPARAMFRAIDAVLEKGGSALVVANRTLPYERELRRLGTLRQLEARAGFKLLAIRR